MNDADLDPTLECYTFRPHVVRKYSNEVNDQHTSPLLLASSSEDAGHVPPNRSNSGISSELVDGDTCGIIPLVCAAVGFVCDVVPVGVSGLPCPVERT